MDRQAIRHLGTVGRTERRKGARLVRKNLKPGTCYLTGNGIRNRVTKIEKENVYIKTNSGRMEIKFPLKAIISAGAYFYRVRLLERKELEVFHNFNSAMFGILKYIFANLARVCRHNRYLRLVMVGVRCFLAGGDKSPRDLSIARAAGSRYVLFSYFYIRGNKAWKAHAKRLGLRVLLDSGAFSLHQARQKGKNVKEISLSEYCQFIREHIDILDGYFVLDVVGDPQKTKENLRLMELQDLTPIPVFHMGSPLSELDVFVEKGYPVIGLGGTVNVSERKRAAFLGVVFNRHPYQCFHGLGISSPGLLSTFPFFSSDSKTWITGRSYGRLVFSQSSAKNPMMAMAENVRNFVKLEDAGYYMCMAELYKKPVQLTLQFE